MVSQRNFKCKPIFTSNYQGDNNILRQSRNTKKSPQLTVGKAYLYHITNGIIHEKQLGDFLTNLSSFQILTSDKAEERSIPLTAELKKIHDNRREPIHCTEIFLRLKKDGQKIWSYTNLTKIRSEPTWNVRYFGKNAWNKKSKITQISNKLRETTEI